MKKKTLFGIIVTMTLVMTLFGALPVKSAWAGTIKIGAIGPMPWIQGQGIAEGTQLAAEQINLGPDGVDNSGTGDDGIIIGGNNYKVEIVTADTLRGMPDPTGTTGAAAASELVAAGCNFVIGGFRTEACMGAREVLMDYEKIWVIAGAATNELVDCGAGTCGKCVTCDYDRYKYVFRATPINSTQLFYAVAGYLKTMMIMKLMPMYTGYAAPLKVAVITEALTWADVIDTYLSMDYFWNTVMGMSTYGGVSVVYHARVSPVTTDVSAELAGVKASGARLLIDIISGPSGRTLATQWADMEVNAFLCGIDVPGQEYPLHWTATGGKCETEAFLVTSGTETPYNARTPAFFSVYSAKYGHAPIYTSYGAYDAVIALEQMLERGNDGIPGTLDDPAWWDPSQPMDGLIPYMEQGIRDGLGSPVWDYCIGNYYANLAIISRFKYTGPHPMSPATYGGYMANATHTYAQVNPNMIGTTHDVYSGPIGTYDDAHGPTWFYGWTRSMVGQWQYNTLVGRGQLENVFPMDQAYSTKTSMAWSEYPLWETDISPNGAIDITDLGAVGTVWLSTAGSDAWNALPTFLGLSCDMNYDKIITVADAQVVALDYGKNVTQFGLTWPLP